MKAGVSSIFFIFPIANVTLPPHEMYSETTGKDANVPEYLDSGILKKMNHRFIVYFGGGDGGL